MTFLTFSRPTKMSLAEKSLSHELDLIMKIKSLTNELDLSKPVETSDDPAAVQKPAEMPCLPAATASEKKSCIRRSSASTGEKRIRFARASTAPSQSLLVHTEVLCLLKPSSEMTTDEKSSIWWDVDDVAYFRGTAALISNEIHHRSKEGLQEGKAPTYAQVVAHALEVCCCQQEAQEEAQELLNLEGNPLPKMVSAYLAHWARQGHSRRGLEKLSVEARAAAFHKHQHECVQAVLSVQAAVALEATGTTMEEERQGRSISREEATREASRRVTASARMYARAMGIADAAALGYKHHDEDKVGVTRRKSKCTEHVNIVSAAA